MQVTYLHHTPVEILAQACAMPYQSEPTEGLVKRVWGRQHRSIARHGMISFAVYDVSVSLLTQISRHPHINLTVMSSRYNDMSAQPCAVPPFVKPKDYEEYQDDYRRAMEIYVKWLRKKGYSEKEQHEMAKMFLTKNSTIDLVVSGNYQAIYEMLELRLCKTKVEWEFNQLAKIILAWCLEKMPVIFEACGPRCESCKDKCGGAVTWEG